MKGRRKRNKKKRGRREKRIKIVDKGDGKEKKTDSWRV